jgi:hypothetical protein
LEAVERAESWVAPIKIPPKLRFDIPLYHDRQGEWSYLNQTSTALDPEI